MVTHGSTTYSVFFQPHVIKKVSYLDVPRLQGLSLSYPTEEDKFMLQDRARFHKTWKRLDALQPLRFLSMVPQSFLPESSAMTSTNMTEFNLNFKLFSTDASFVEAMKSLLVFPRSTPAFESLKIHTPSRTRFSSGSQHKVLDLVEIVLQHLRLRQLDFHLYNEAGGDFDAAYLSQLVTVLAMPALSSVSVRFSYFTTPYVSGNIPRDVSQLVNCLLPSGHHAPALSRLEILVSGSYFSSLKLSLDAISELQSTQGRHCRRA